MILDDIIKKTKEDLVKREKEFSLDWLGRSLAFNSRQPREVIPFLQATEEELGTCMLGWFNEKKVKKTLSIPKFKRVELIISVGFSADDNIPHKKRKSIDEIMSYNKYN